jgi:hypothetical protein
LLRPYFGSCDTLVGRSKQRPYVAGFALKE